MKTLAEMKLEHYTILDCEPLHDLKGHIQNVLDEVPGRLEKNLAFEVRALIDTDLGKDMKTGGDYRLTAIHLLTLLQKRATHPDILQLIQSLVEISELLYADDSKRSPKSILRLYNLTWVHFELCCQLFQITKTMSHQKMFGIYLHALIIHAASQYEIMSLKSANSEHEERLFGQAKNMVHSATNRQPTNVIPNILLRLQARKRQGDLHKANTISSKISKEFHEMDCTSKNTTVSHTFISSRMSSWQSHLVRISPFLLAGKNGWWKKTKDGYEFLDGKHEPDSHATGPRLFHFRSKTLEMVYKEKKLVFQLLLDHNVDLPTLYIKLYSEDGKFIGIKQFNEQGIAEGANEEMEDEPETDKNMQIMVERESGEEDEQVEDEPVQNKELKTKLCIAISKALGRDRLDLILTLDGIRHKLKHENRTEESISQHRHYISKIKEHLKKQESALKIQIKNLENSFYLKHNRLPDEDTEDYRSLIKSKRYIAKLLKCPEF